MGISRLLTIQLLSLLLCGYASAEFYPTQDVKPIVLFLLDTSGSMEYDVTGYSSETGDNDVAAVPPCTDSYLDGFEYRKSRFVVAQEVISGTYKNYWCSYDDRLSPPSREDKGYPVKHVIPKSHGYPSPQQNPDGLIDLNLDRFKFGLMTFDTNPDAGSGNGGGYSYGNEAPINYGARNQNAPTGQFVKPSPSDDNASVLLKNLEVQSTLLSVIPFGGTPISPMLQDAKHFFLTDADFQPFNQTNGKGDPYYDCRSKNIILITDGRANLGENEDCYPSSIVSANQLYNAGVKVYVVGYQLSPGVDTLVHQIANAGGTNEAYIVTNPAELAVALSKILMSISVGVQSRTKSVVTNNTKSYYDKQFQFNAAFGPVNNDPMIKQGYLERSVYRCPYDCGAQDTSGGVELCEVQSISDKLNGLTGDTRTIMAVVDGVFQNFVIDNTQLTADVLNIPASGELIDISPVTLPGGLTVCGSSILTGEDKRNIFRNNLIKFIRGAPDSCRKDYKMGAIYHSTPAIQTDLSDVNTVSPSFKKYIQMIAGRPTVLYTASTEGILHAFRTDRPPDILETDDGKEIWGIIPHHILKKLHTLSIGYKVLFDGSPVVKDILLERTLATVESPDVEKLKWKSVLVVGYREGGRGYLALDVTDPASPQFMWEIDNERRCVKEFNGVNCYLATSDDINDYSKLGLSYSTPVIGTIFITENSILKEKAVALFGGGSGYGLEAGAGMAFFVVDLATGEKIMEFSNSKGNIIDGVEDGSMDPDNALDAAITGSPACYNTFYGTFITRCYIGDEKGQLWRVGIGSKTKSNWRMQFFHDPYKDIEIGINSSLRSPIYDAPAIGLKQDGNIVVIYGTGNIDNLDEVTLVNAIYSLEESKLLNQSGNMIGYRATPIWRILLPAGEKLMGSPTIFGGVSYFTTFFPQVTNACSPGTGRLWGVNYEKNGGTLDQIIGKLDENGTTNMVITGAIPYGVEVVQRPACSEGKSLDSAWNQGAASPKLGEMEGGTPTLVIQTATKSSASDETVPVGSTVEPIVAKKLQELSKPPTTIFASSWGMVFD